MTHHRLALSVILARVDQAQAEVDDIKRGKTDQKIRRRLKRVKAMLKRTRNEIACPQAGEKTL